MTAFVLGAGLGTRLRPLTLVRPKPLIPVGNRPLIHFAFDHLIAAGVDRFVVNTHWLAEVYTELFPDGQYRGVPIHFRHEPEILETAGGLKNAEDLLGGEPFLVYNGDILTDLPLAPALAAHREQGNEVTLVLRSKDGPLQISLDAEGRLLDIGGRLASGTQGNHLFTGIYLVEPAFLQRLTAGEKISVIPFFLEMIRTGAKLGAVVIDEGHWWDLGSREQYLAVHQHYAAEAPWIDPGAEVDPTAQVTGASAIGAGASIGARAQVRDSLVWPGAEVAAGATLERCIVTGPQPVSGNHSETDL
jgi:mannose-1-phosphate guanylyltransferase